MRRPRHCWPVLISIVRVELVSDLPAALSSSELPSKFKPRVPVDSDLSPIDNLEVEAVKCLLSLCPCSILEEAETARSLLDFVESHNQVHDLAALRKELIELGLVSVEGQIPNIKRGRELESILIFIRRET